MEEEARSAPQGVGFRTARCADLRDRVREHPEMAAEFHGVDPKSSQGKALARKYYEYLLDHRVSSYHIPVDLMSPRRRPIWKILG